MGSDNREVQAAAGRSGLLVRSLRTNNPTVATHRSTTRSEFPGRWHDRPGKDPERSQRIQAKTSTRRSENDKEPREMDGAKVSSRASSCGFSGSLSNW